MFLLHTRTQGVFIYTVYITGSSSCIPIPTLSLTLYGIGEGLPFSVGGVLLGARSLPPSLQV